MSISEQETNLLETVEGGLDVDSVRKAILEGRVALKVLAYPWGVEFQFQPTNASACTAEGGTSR